MCRCGDSGRTALPIANGSSCGVGCRLIGSRRESVFAMPGSLCACGGGISLATSLWSDRLYAADPLPRSCVWRNHAGSREPRDAAISLRDRGSSTAVTSSFGLSACSRGSARAPDSGRERMDPKPEPIPRDSGLCCHDSVPLLDSPAEVGV